MTRSLLEAYGPWALITGASRGVGAEFARQLAAAGLNIVLVATNEPLLQTRATEIEHTFGVKTRVIALDLSLRDKVDALAAQTDDLEIGMLINNAGISTVGPFMTQTPDYLSRQIDINNRAGVLLTRHFASPMKSRGRGGIVFVSSGSAQHGTPFSANYAATKSYYKILAESLWYELRPAGIDVLGFLLGATRTDGWTGQAPKPDWLVPVGDVAPAVADALRALGRRPTIANGFMNKIGYSFMNIVSTAQAVKILGASMNKMFGPFN